MELFDQIQETLAYLRSQTPISPRTAIILGTGLGNLATQVAEKLEIPYQNIPHFASSTVESHAGKLVVGYLEGFPVAVLAGRFHYYEGWSMHQVTFPVRVLAAWGCERFVITNASGGINPNLRSGDIVVVKDHINLLPENPLRGPNDERLGPRFPDLSAVYDSDLRKKALEIANQAGIRAFEGIYSALQGPNLETPAEYRMLRILGSDCTGMSSVPEALVAHHMGKMVLMLSMVTNVSFPPSVIKETTVEEVIAIASAAEPGLSQIIKGIVREFSI